MSATRSSGGHEGGSGRPGASDGGGGGFRWGRFAFVLLDVVLVLVVGFIWYLLFVLWQWHQATGEDTPGPEPAPVVFSGTMDATPLPQARAQALGMVMEAYQALSEQAGVGDWQPGSDYHTQVRESGLDCGTGGAEEVYDLADAAPYADEEQALAIVEQVAAPYGFRPGAGAEHADADLVREADQATITLSNRRGGTMRVTSLAVSSGCHRGSFLEDWPAGTEVVPGYLRGKGPDASPWVWPSQVPAVPTPLQGWPAPTRTPTPTTSPAGLSPSGPATAGPSPAGSRPGPSPTTSTGPGPSPPRPATRGQ